LWLLGFKRLGEIFGTHAEWRYMHIYGKKGKTPFNYKLFSDQYFFEIDEISEISGKKMY